MWPRRQAGPKSGWSPSSGATPERVIISTVAQPSLVGEIAERLTARRRRHLLEPKQSAGSAGCDDVLPGLDDHDSDGALRCGHRRIRGRGLVRLIVELDTEVAEPLADGAAHDGRVLANAGGEHERVEAAKRSRHRADGEGYAVHEDCKRDAGAL